MKNWKKVGKGRQLQPAGGVRVGAERCYVAGGWCTGMCVVGAGGSRGGCVCMRVCERELPRVPGRVQPHGRAAGGAGPAELRDGTGPRSGTGPVPAVLPFPSSPGAALHQGRDPAENSTCFFSPL